MYQQLNCYQAVSLIKCIHGIEIKKKSAFLSSTYSEKTLAYYQ